MIVKYCHCEEQCDEAIQQTSLIAALLLVACNDGFFEENSSQAILIFGLLGAFPYWYPRELTGEGYSWSFHAERNRQGWLTLDA
ncbi:MAG: hypothetical protein R3D66_04810 [Alphaproteobacteria bacterium]